MYILYFLTVSYFVDYASFIQNSSTLHNHMLRQHVGLSVIFFMDQNS